MAEEEGAATAAASSSSANDDDYDTFSAPLLKRIKCEPLDDYEPAPSYATSHAPSASPEDAAEKANEADDDEIRPATPPRILRRRESAEAARRKMKGGVDAAVTVGSAPNTKGTAEIKEEDRKASDSPSDSREGSCERSDCPVQKTCCLGIMENCVGTRSDCSGKLFYHMSKGEHVCMACYESFWKSGRPQYDRFMEWKARWSNESRCLASLKAFLQDQWLPFWLACQECRRFRRLPHDAPTPTPADVAAFECGRCAEPEDPRVAVASERVFVTSLVAAPLLHHSPALHYLAGDAYFYDELGMSPTNSHYDPTLQAECLSGAFMHPFNDPYGTSVAFSLRPDCLEYDELSAFPEYVIEQVPYLAVRNLIVALWTLNPFQYLTPSECESHLMCRGLARVWFVRELARIYDFLNMKGIINYGILDLPAKPLSILNTRSLEVIIVGAGISGLAAARQLRAFGVKVKVLEAKAKIGGRMQDDWSLGVAVGCGAQLITGVVNNPIALMCEQTGVAYRALTEGCPLLDAATGRRVETRVDRVVDEQFNATLDTLAHWKSRGGDGVHDASLLGRN